MSKCKCHYISGLRVVKGCWTLSVQCPSVHDHLLAQSIFLFLLQIMRQFWGTSSQQLGDLKETISTWKWSLPSKKMLFWYVANVTGPILINSSDVCIHVRSWTRDFIGFYSFVFLFVFVFYSVCICIVFYFYLYLYFIVFV